MASAVFKTVARPHERSRVGSTPMHSRQPRSTQLSAFNSPEPPSRALEAFRADGRVTRMAGGQGTSFRAGRIVLKPVSNEEETNWIADLFSGLSGPGFRVPRPIAATGGGWVVEGWGASEFVDADHADPNGGRWPETITACRAFHSAIRGVPRPDLIDRADHAWAVADRLAWGELEFEPLPGFERVIGRLQDLLRPLEAERQLIHGDFTANVLFVDGEAPCVIDFSPYWRPAAFAEAVVIADAIAWSGSDHSLVELCADVPDFPQYFIRAVLRRVWELDQHLRRGREFTVSHLAQYEPLLGLSESLVLKKG